MPLLACQVAILILSDLQIILFLVRYNISQIQIIQLENQSGLVLMNYLKKDMCGTILQFYNLLLQNFDEKTKIDKERAKRQATDKRLVQRDLRNQERLPILNTKKIDLLDMDKNLISLNPNLYKPSGYVNQRIIQEEININKKSQEDLEKFQENIKQKEEKQYLDSLSLLNGEEIAKNSVFKGSLKFKEETKMPKDESQYVKTYNWGLKKSALKNKLDIDSTTIGQTLRESIIQKQLEEKDEKSNQQFLSVILKDLEFSKQQIKDIYPEVDDDKIQTQSRILHEKDIEIQYLLQPKSQNTIGQQSKVRFNDTAQQVVYYNDAYFDDEQSIFRDTEQLGNALTDSLNNQRIQQKQIPKEQEEKFNNWQSNWSFGSMQINNSNHDVRFLSNKAQMNRYNNVYLNSALQKDLQYYKSEDQGVAISKSLSKLDNLKYHQYQPVIEDIQFKQQAKTQTEVVLQKQKELTEKYLDKDLEDDENYIPYIKEREEIDKIVDEKGYDIQQPIENLMIETNNHQLQGLQKYQPNYFALKQLDYAKIDSAFHSQPLGNGGNLKSIFSQFNDHIKSPLDIMHHETQTQQIAEQKEKQYLDQERQNKLNYVNRKLPNPLFKQNIGDYYIEPEKQEKWLHTKFNPTIQLVIGKKISTIKFL
ncbi:hypothetical protein pb186bvf_006278 [Paramecium bursaria]